MAGRTNVESEALSWRGRYGSKGLAGWPMRRGGVAVGGVAAVMLLVGSDTALDGLKTITIVAAVPFVLVTIGLCVSLVKDLSTDPMIVRARCARPYQDVLSGLPSWKPAADCTPMTARSWNSASVVAPA